MHGPAASLTNRMNQTALEQQLAALHADSFAWAMTCCDHRRADAEDALQTAYLRVLNGRATYRGASSFRTWLFAVIRHAAAEERRRWWRHWRRNGHANHDAVCLPDYEYRVELDEDARQLARALESLPRRQREVIELVFYHDLSIAEASVVLNIGLGTARTHYERGKKNLSKRLEGFEP